jgi:O-antigen/teichoic acid export membrane protein
MYENREWFQSAETNQIARDAFVPDSAPADMTPGCDDHNLGDAGLTRASMAGRLRSWLAASPFLRNASVMMVGTTLGQAASVALAPVLTRLYTAEDFGTLSVYTAVLAILGVTAALGLDLAIPLAASEFELANLIAGAGAAVVITSGLVGLAMALIPSPVLDLIWLGPLDAYRYLVPLGLACLGGYYVMVAAATCAERFADIARTRITQGVGGPVSQIALGWLGAGGQGLAIGFIIGQSSGFFLLLSRVVLGRPSLRNAISWRGMVATVARYIHFPLFASWTRVVEMAGSGTVLYLLFSAYYSAEVVGFMFLGERVVARPLLMVSTSLLQVFSGEAGRSARLDPSALRRRFRQVVLGQFLFALAWILPVNLLAGWGVPLLFGAPWAAAVPYLHALSLAYLALAVMHPVSTTLQLLHRQRLAAVWQVSRLCLLIAAAVASHQAGLPAVPALWICSCIQVASCIGTLTTMAICIQRLVHGQITGARDSGAPPDPAKSAARRIQVVP